jgi:hypothetical protein
MGFSSLPWETSHSFKNGLSTVQKLTCLFVFYKEIHKKCLDFNQWSSNANGGNLHN